MKRLIERIKGTFRRDKLPQDISNHLASTRNIYDFIREDKNKESYIPIPKEIYDKGPEMVFDWNNSILKTINIHSHLSYMNFKENLNRRGYAFVSNYKETEKELMDGDDYLLN